MKCLQQHEGKNFVIYNGDSVEILQGIPENSIHLSVTSIPFASLYTYSNSERDMGNSRTYDEFAAQYMFLGREWFRVMMPGRIVCIHCMNLPTSKERDGFILHQRYEKPLLSLPPEESMKVIKALFLHFRGEEIDFELGDMQYVNCASIAQSASGMSGRAICRTMRL